jgi:hypothetical protein
VFVLPSWQILYKALFFSVLLPLYVLGAGLTTILSAFLPNEAISEFSVFVVSSSEKRWDRFWMGFFTTTVLSMFCLVSGLYAALMLIIHSSENLEYDYL